jgi:hypothetical protein
MRPIWSDADWEQLSMKEREHYVTWLLQMANCDVAMAISAALSNLSYHARCLREQNIIRCTGTKQIRGSTQHLYASNVSDNKLVNTILSETADDDRYLCRRSG